MKKRAILIGVILALILSLVPATVLAGNGNSPGKRTQGVVYPWPFPYPPEHGRFYICR